MHPPSNDKPTQGQLVFPLLETLASFGGSGAAIDVAAALADRLNLPTAVTQATKRVGDGQVVDLWRRHVRFAREKAKAMGYVASERRGGTWHLTEAGNHGLQYAQPAIVVEILTGRDGVPVCARVDMCVGVPTTHLLAQGDARDLAFIGDGEIPLIITSCPYFDLKEYDHVNGQLGDAPSYTAFLDAMHDVLRECQRLLMPGGRLALNVGDILRSRKAHGEHHVLPLHADLLTRAVDLGFRSLTGILWQKNTNVNYEQGGRGVLGKPWQPNGVIKAELEHILLLRKAGPYRRVSDDVARASALSKAEYGAWFRPLWSDVHGTATTGAHPAPFPIAIPYRLARMFSFVGDTVLDPFAGMATTALGCAKAGRHSACVDVSARYLGAAIERLGRGDIELAGAR